MKLTFWYAACLNDSDCYSIRAKTLKECRKLVALHGEEDGAEVDSGDWHSRSRFENPVKVIIEYRDGFDLMCQCCDEGGINYHRVD